MEKKRLRGNRSDHTVGCILKKVIDCNCTIAIFLLLAAEACFTNYFPVVSVEICKHEKDTLRHYHINLVGILFLCEDAFELLTDENVVMFGLIMSKLNSVRIGKLNRATRDRRSSQRPARRQAGRGGSEVGDASSWLFNLENQMQKYSTTSFRKGWNKKRGISFGNLFRRTTISGTRLGPVWAPFFFAVKLN